MEKAEKKIEDVNETLDDLHQTNATRGYFNGFTISYSPSDFVFILQHNGIPFAYFNASPVVAKGVSQVLTELVKQYEEKNETVIPDMPDLVIPG